MFIVLGLEFLCSAYIGVGNFKTLDDNAYASNKGSHKRLFIYMVTIPEGIAVKKDISGHCLSIQSGKDMDAKPLIKRKKRGSRLSKGALVSEPGRIRKVPKSLGTFHPKRNSVPVLAKVATVLRPSLWAKRLRLYYRLIKPFFMIRLGALGWLPPPPNTA